MGIVKLPSGKIVKTPDGMTKEESIEFLFKNLEGREGFEEDREKLGRQLDTSGWGSIIGGTVGGIGGAIGGSFVAPFAGTVAGGTAGGTLGSATGEKIEQWLTGRGDSYDVGDAAMYGALGGVGGGAGGAALKGAAKLGLNAAGKSAVGAGVGAGIGAGSSVITGADPLISAGIGAVTGGTSVGQGIAKGVGSKVAGSKLAGVVKDNKVVQSAVRHTGLNREINTLGEVWKGPASDMASGIFKQMTGRTAAGGLQKAGARWDLQRNAIGYVGTQVKKFFSKNLTEGLKKSGKTIDDKTAKAINKKADELTKQTLEENADYQAFLKSKDNSLNQGGQIEDKRKNKLRKLHSEGYDPKQAYAIMKSYEKRGKLNMGGEVLPRYEGGGLVNQDVVEGAYIPDTIVSSIPVGSYIVNAAAANHPQFKRELLEMGGKVIEDDFNPKFGKDYVEAMVGKEEIYLNPHITKKHGKYIEQVNDWGRDVKKRLGT